MSHVGPPKTNGSGWRVLTKRGPLEKGMANHFRSGTGPTGALACMQPVRVAPWWPMMAHFWMLLQLVIGRGLSGEWHILGAETNSKRHHNCIALSIAGAKILFLEEDLGVWFQVLHIQWLYSHLYEPKFLERYSLLPAPRGKVIL